MGKHPKTENKVGQQKKSSQQNIWLFYKVANLTQNVLVAWNKGDSGSKYFEGNMTW